MGISLGGPLPAAEGKADRGLSTTGFPPPHATSLPRGRRGTGLLELPSSGMFKDRGCRKVPLGFPKEFADATMSSILPPPPQAPPVLPPKGFLLYSGLWAPELPPQSRGDQVTLTEEHTSIQATLG